MLELTELRRAVARGGRVVRIVVAETRGSAPREAGTAMLVGPDFEMGTIGGGTLEFEAIRKARGLTADLAERKALGPDLGQCCGGAVTLLYEIWDATRLDGMDGTPYARPLPGHTGEIPFVIRKMLAESRTAGAALSSMLADGWFVEMIARPARRIWVWGAGHVGRAIVSVLSPLPGFEITWVDTARDRFPTEISEGVTVLPAADPALLAAHAPEDAEHLIVTFSHALDLALCDALLRRGFTFCGLIGSKSKWARFRKRLANFGHSPALIGSITCPIGHRDLGKHPQEIAVGVAFDVIRGNARENATMTGGEAKGDGDFEGGSAVNLGPDEGLSGGGRQ